MENRGPLITLVAVAALAVVLLVLNLKATTQTATTPTVTAPAAPPASTQAPIGSVPAPPQPAAYAGRTSGNEATIAIVVRNGRAAAYVCDGHRVEAWLQGTIADGQLTLGGNNGARATGAVEGNAVFGTVWVKDKQWPYSAQLAKPPAGLYQGRGTVNGVPNRLGWIVLDDGSEVGIRNNNGTPEPAPTLDPNTLASITVDGTRIDPQPVNGDTLVVGK
ncbi:MAG TPA: hypothetical protein VIY28_15305 [Pseudonocardiaceae bacterium]